MASSSEWEEGIGGNFPIHKAVTAALPAGTQIISAESSGISAWTKTAKISVTLADGSPKRYFLKVASGESARGLAEGEFHSAAAISELVPGFVPNPTGWGQYHNETSQVYFFVGDFHDLDLSVAPDPEELMSKIVELHQKGVNPDGKYGYHVSTGFGIMARTVDWKDTWAESFTQQLQDVINMDNGTNGCWPEYDAACKQLIDVVIPRLLGALETDGRTIEPTLIHGDLWERNVGIDMETGNVITWDPGCTYAHNEMEFGTWRCSWAYHFASPIYMQIYQGHIEPSEPAEEWDDRNRLYSMYPYLNNSGGRPGSFSRQIAYNDMLYLIEKYGPLDTLEKYNPERDPTVAGSSVSAAT